MKLKKNEKVFLKAAVKSDFRWYARVFDALSISYDIDKCLKSESDIIDIIDGKKTINEIDREVRELASVMLGNDAIWITEFFSCFSKSSILGFLARSVGRGNYSKLLDRFSKELL